MLREKQFTIIDNNKTKKFIKWLFNPYLKISGKFYNKISRMTIVNHIDKFYDCLTDEKRLLQLLII